ncbi:MAG TPA: glycosyltransferase [Coriobacteriia bacterium]|jgi:hypothetical protein
MKLTFLIATRNRREALLRCLRSIERSVDGERQIVVVDDASEDGTAEAVRVESPSAVLLRNDRRAGVGAAHALGFEEATGEVVVCLDDDAYLVSDEPEARIRERFAAAPELGALCFRVEALDGSVRRREIPLRSKRLPDRDAELGYFLGGAVAYRAAALKDAGGFAAHIGYGSVELDLAFRLFARGWSTLFTPSVRVVHEAIPSPHNTTEREANYVRSHIEMAARYLPAPYAPVHALLWCGELFAEAAGKGHLGRTVAAAWGAMRRWPTLRAERGYRLSRTQAARLTRLSGRTWY